MTPWMHSLEIDLIKSNLNPSDIMLEWGSGGSTISFSPLVKKYYSIEHVEKWYQQVGNTIKSKNYLNVNYHLIPPNYPRTKPTKYTEFKSYIEKPTEFNTKFNKVLIDGRGRQYCAAYILRHLTPSSIVFIHDFWKRPQYHKVLDWYNEVGSIKNTLQTIVALSPKPKYCGLFLNQQEIVEHFVFSTPIPTLGLFNI